MDHTQLIGASFRTLMLEVDSQLRNESNLDLHHLKGALEAFYRWTIEPPEALPPISGEDAVRRRFAAEKGFGIALLYIIQQATIESHPHSKIAFIDMVNRVMIDTGARSFRIVWVAACRRDPFLQEFVKYFHRPFRFNLGDENIPEFGYFVGQAAFVLNAYRRLVLDEPEVTSEGLEVDPSGLEIISQGVQSVDLRQVADALMTTKERTSKYHEQYLGHLRDCKEQAAEYRRERIRSLHVADIDQSTLKRYKQEVVEGFHKHQSFMEKLPSAVANRSTQIRVAVERPQPKELFLPETDVDTSQVFRLHGKQLAVQAQQNLIRRAYEMMTGRGSVIVYQNRVFTPEILRSVELRANAAGIDSGVVLTSAPVAIGYADQSERWPVYSIGDMVPEGVTLALSQAFCRLMSVGNLIVKSPVEPDINSGQPGAGEYVLVGAECVIGWDELGQIRPGLAILHKGFRGFEWQA